MRIRAERDDLADVLARAGRAVGTRSPLPILQGVLCEVAGGKLTVTGTDNEVTVRTYLEVEALEEGRTVIPAKLAADAVRKLPVGAVSMNAADGEVEITGNGPRFRLREMTVEDFPKVADGIPAESVDVDGGALIRAISQVGVAGGVRIEDGAFLLGHVGVAGHLTIGAGALVGGQAGVTRDVAPNARVFGFPAGEGRAWQKESVALKRLPELLKRVRALEKWIAAHESGASDADATDADALESDA